jgi:hypothetical protein
MIGITLEEVWTIVLCLNAAAAVCVWRIAGMRKAHLAAGKWKHISSLGVRH